jgi:hypothetical protein
LLLLLSVCSEGLLWHVMLTPIKINESLPTKCGVVLLTVTVLLLLHSSRSERMLWHVMLAPIKISTSPLAFN